jgi:hypothetical protein
MPVRQEQAVNCMLYAVSSENIVRISLYPHDTHVVFDTFA